MAKIIVTMEAVIKCKECLHLGQRGKVRAFYAIPMNTSLLKYATSVRAFCRGASLYIPWFPTGI